jgi:hypothetical protein
MRPVGIAWLRREGPEIHRMTSADVDVVVLRFVAKARRVIAAVLNDQAAARKWAAEHAKAIRLPEKCSASAMNPGHLLRKGAVLELDGARSDASHRLGRCRDRSWVPRGRAAVADPQYPGGAEQRPPVRANAAQPKRTFVGRRPSPRPPRQRRWAWLLFATDVTHPDQHQPGARRDAAWR